MSGTAAYRVTTLDGMGTTSTRRYASTSNKYDHLWNKSHLNGGEKTLIRKGQIIDEASTTLATQSHMNNIVANTLDQTEMIAEELRGASLHQTLKNIARFFREFYAYKQDHQDREQIRTPIRAWSDRFDGIDCDCFSTSISSILHNLGIDHFWRKSKDQAKGDYTHIYVIVPKQKGLDLSIRGNYYVLDPVVGDFDMEWPNNDVPQYYEDFHVKYGNGMGLTLQFIPSFDPLKIALITGAIGLAGFGIYKYYQKNN